MKYFFIFAIVISLVFLSLRVNDVEQFHRAIDEKQLSVASDFLNQGFDINSPDKIGWYPIHTAALKQDAQLLGFLLENGADINVRNEQGWTPLHYAIAAGSGYSGAMLLRKHRKKIRNSKSYRFFNKDDWPTSTSIVNLLIENGSNIIIEDYRGISPLDVAVITNNIEIIRKLVSLDSSLLESNALHHAAQSKNVEAVKALLALGFNVNSINSANNTPLHIAVSRASYKNVKPKAIAITKLLIEKEADLRASNNRGQTPLITASRGHAPYDIIKLLLDNHAEVDAQDDDGKTALFYASGRNRKKPLEIGLYIDQGADVNHKSYQSRTPLHSASRGGSAEIIKFLIRNGANMHAVDHKGISPIHIAARWNKRTLVELLSQGVDVNKTDDNGQTPLHYAAQWKPHLDSLDDGEDQKPENVITLLKQGADIYIKDSNGQTAIDVAKQDGERRTVKIFEVYRSKNPN